MFDTIADMLRGSAPDDLAHALGTDRTQTRRAMEIGLPALITGLRDKTLEPGGAQNLAAMLDDPDAAVPGDLDAYLAAGNPAQGAAMLDVAFGDRGEPALGALSEASGLSTRLLAQVMSVLAPLATGTVAQAADRSPDGLRSYLSDAVSDLQGKGFGRVVDLVSPTGLSLGSDLLMDPEPIDIIDDLGDGLSDGHDVVDVADNVVDLPDVDLPDVDVPDVDDPDVEVPQVDVGGTVVEGAFPDAVGDVSLGDTEVSLDEPTEAISIGDLDLGDDVDVQIDAPDIDAPDIDAPDIDLSVPDFGVEVENVTPQGVSIVGDQADLASTSVAVADPELPGTALGIDPEEPELEGLSSRGWLWWLLGAVLGLILLGLAISQCGGSDGVDVTSDTPDVAVEPTVDPLLAQRQATLDQITANYPGVQGEMVGEVAVLTGTVADQMTLAELDSAVRAAGLSVNNSVVATGESATAQQGYVINDLIDAQPELSTLKQLLAEAGLGDALAGGGEFTLFAPTNDAFSAIQSDLDALRADPDALREVLQYHLLVGTQDSTAVSSSAALPTVLEGQSIAVDASSGQLLLNGATQVLVADAAANNGVMHIVNQVLLPTVAAELPEEIGAELGLNPITFALGSSEITDAGKVELDKVVAFLQATPGAIEIGGHTDSDGDPGYNQTLSQERADAVKDYLAAQGIPAESMTARGYGPDQPIAPNDTPENKALNRRIEFRPVN